MHNLPISIEHASPNLGLWLDVQNLYERMTSLIASDLPAPTLG